MSLDQGEIFEFGPFRMSARERTLTRAGESINLTPKVFDILAFLVSNAGRLITREELLAKIWPESFVEESNLTVSISMLRKALGEAYGGYVQTVPKQGYRFTVEVVRPVAMPEPAPAPAKPSGLPKAVLAAVAVATVFLAVAGLYRTLSPRSDEPGLRAAPLTSDIGLEYTASISPDGARVAYTWMKDANESGIYVRQVPAGEPVRVSKAGEVSLRPTWSPDGSQIAYLIGDGDVFRLVVLPLLGGGSRRELTSVRTRASWFSGQTLAWSPDGKWIAYAELDGQDLLHISAVSVENGEKRQITHPPPTMLGDQHPAFSSDGATLLFSRNQTTTLGDYYALRLKAGLEPDGEPKRIRSMQGACGGIAWIPGTREAVFASGPYLGSSLYRMEIRQRDLTATAPRPLPFPTEGATEPTVSAPGPRTPGRLVFERLVTDVNLWRVPLKGEGGAAPWAPSTRLDQYPAYSPDGSKVAFASSRSGSFEIWVCGSEGSNCLQATRFGNAYTRAPRWSPDGKTLVFDSRAGGQSDLYTVPAEGGVPKRLTNTAWNEVRPVWSPDGATVYFESTQTGQRNIWKMPAPGGAAAQVTLDGGAFAHVSADGQWLYFQRTLSTDILRMPIGGGAAVTAIPGKWMTFTISGNTAFLDVPDGVMASDLATGKTRRIVEVTKGSMDANGLAVSPDGKWLLYPRLESSTADLYFVENFR